MSELIYKINEKPRTAKEWIMYTIQFTFAVLTATVLIATICGTNIAAGMVAAGISTLVFLCITKFKAPVVISNSGATVSAVLGAIALSRSVETNLLGVVLGGVTIMIIYSLAAYLIKKFGIGWLTKLIPPIISGTTIMVIGATLAGFIPTYAQVGGSYSLIGGAVAIFTMLVIVMCMHYGKGMVKTLPFLIGLLAGYVISIILTLLGVAPLVNLAALDFNRIIAVPDFAFLHLNFATFDWSTLPQIILLFGLVSLAAMTEHIGDMMTASAASKSNLLEEPGLHRTLLGDGVGSFIGTLIGAQPNTTYSEYTSTVVVSKVASVYVTFTTACTLILLGMFGPFNQFITSLPNCVFAGVSMVAYGMIAMAGLRTIIDNHIDFTNNKNIAIFATMLACGVSGFSITAGSFNLSGIALAMVVGIILNLILKDSKRA